MSDYDLELLDQHRGKGILIDANLLLLIFIGTYDRSLISRFKRTQSFTEKDFDLVVDNFVRPNKIITTPNILTEVNGFSNQLIGTLKEQYFRNIGVQIERLEEHYLSSLDIAQQPEFILFGLTDAVIFRLAAESKYLVATIDTRLAVYLQQYGLDAINFNHFRTYF